MNSTKIINALLIAVVVGLIAWGLTLIHAPQKGGMSSILGGTATTTQAGKGFEYTESHPYYTVDVTYPDVSQDLSAPASQTAQAAIENEFKSEVADYKQSVDSLTPADMPSLGQDYKLAFSVTFEKYGGTVPGVGDVVSYFFTAYSDTGGAHPNGYFKTFVFDQSGNQLVITDIADLNKLSVLVSADLTKQLEERTGIQRGSTTISPDGLPDSTWATFDEGVAPTENNYSNFVVDGSNLLIEIPPYQVAAYAAGSFESRVPLAQVAK